jgi:DNA topoisomerase-1
MQKLPDGSSEEAVLALNGKFGPYMKWGKETRSIPPEHTPLSIDLATALQIFAQPKQNRSRRSSAPAKVLRELGEHPESKVMVKLLDGRYGPYVTDGTTNASLSKGEDPAGLGLARAIELLQARAGKGKGKARPRRRVARTGG